MSLLHLAGDNVSKGREFVVQCMVIDALVQVLDEDITNARLTDRRITLGPHDATRTTLDCLKVHCIQSTFSWKITSTRHPLHELFI